MRDRWLDPFRGVRMHPLAVDAEAEKRAEPFELLVGGDRSNLPLFPIPAHLIDASRSLSCSVLSKMSLVLRPDNHRRIKRSGVAGEFAVHRAGEIDASDQVLSKRVIHAAQTNGLVAESEWS